MFSRLVLILAAVPAIALAQDAPPSAPVAPPPADAPATDAATPSPPPATPKLAAAAPAPADPADCRIACAQASYVCRAGDVPAGCDGAWSQCVSACDLPNLAPSFSTAP